MNTQEAMSIIRNNVRVHNDCWEWVGPLDTRGYARVRIDGTVKQAWHLAFFVARGFWPASGRRLRTSCNNRACCNPTHVNYFDEGGRTCTVCGGSKSIDNFKKSDSLSSICSTCRKQRQKLRYTENRANILRKQREYVLNKKYKITEQDYLTLGAKQEWLCAICSQYMDVPHIDHDHETGKLRELLCFQCNAALGHFQDSVERIERAAQYIKRHRDNN